jgi:hypothetical protein
VTRQQVIDYIAAHLWASGIGSKGGGRIAAAEMVDRLIEAGVLVVMDEAEAEDAKKVRAMRAVQGW